MQFPQTAHVLRIYIGEGLHHGSVPVYEALIGRARIMNLAGATIHKNHKGFGHAEVAGTQNYRMSTELPVVIEIVDTPANIQTFIPVAKEMLQNRGLMTLHEAQIVHQGAWPEAGKP